MHISNLKKIIPKAVLMLPTSIRLETTDQPWELSSFLFRDNCVRTLESLRKAFIKRSYEISSDPGSPQESSKGSLDLASTATYFPETKSSQRRPPTIKLPSRTHQEFKTTGEIPTSALVLATCVTILCVSNLILLLKATSLLVYL
jgi:hypothetical protein